MFVVIYWHIQNPGKHLKWGVLKKLLSSKTCLRLTRFWIHVYYLLQIIGIIIKRKIRFYISKIDFNFIKKETLPQVFSCEFYEIYRNTFFIEHLRWLLLLNIIKQKNFHRSLSTIYNKQERNQEFFRAGKNPWNKGTSINISTTAKWEKSPTG